MTDGVIFLGMRNCIQSVTATNNVQIYKHNIQHSNIIIIEAHVEFHIHT